MWLPWMQLKEKRNRNEKQGINRKKMADLSLNIAIFTSNINDHNAPI